VDWCGRPHVERSGRLFLRDAWLEPADDVAERPPALITVSGRAELAGAGGRRPVFGRRDIEPADVFRHDPDDHARYAVGPHDAPDRRRVAAEPLHPASVTQHDWRAPGHLVVCGRERASERCVYAQHLEEVAGDMGG